MFKKNQHMHFSFPSTWDEKPFLLAFDEGDSGGSGSADDDGGDAGDVDIELEIDDDEGDSTDDDDAGDFGSDDDSDDSGSDGDDSGDTDDDSSDDLDGTDDADTKTVPISVLLAERAKNKAKLEELKAKAEFTDALMQTTGKDVQTLKAEMDAMAIQSHIDNGMSPEAAQAYVANMRYMADMAQSLNRQKYDLEVATLKSNPFFADIEDVRDELEAVASRTGMTIEQSYMATRGTQRMADYAREIEQGVLNRQAKKPKKVDTTGTGTATKAKPKLNLSADEIAVADAAVKAGVFKSRAEYAKYKQKT